MKRHFYTLVSKQKKVLGERHLGYYANTNKMFSAALKKPVSDWVKFVTEELIQRPEQWKDEGQLKRINGLANKNGKILK